jgi:hypothetical protein
MTERPGLERLREKIAVCAPLSSGILTFDRAKRT